MESVAVEWLSLLFRWVHVIAAIMWIGDSFLFVWMDRSLSPPEKPREGAVVGELWMVHSGGFYEVVKRKSLAPTELPSSLHWFKWEAYTTWISGFFLLGVVYYFGGGLYLVDRAVNQIPIGAAIALSVGLLVASWLVYDALWSSPLAKNGRLATAISFALIVAASFGLSRTFTGRAAYLHLGAMLGTVMVANVWRRIIPAQRQMLAATRAGKPVDTSLGVRAKERSIHNHYLTLPVLFTMLSNHLPSAYGHRLNWLVLVLIVIVGVAAKHVMNYRRASSRLAVLGGGAALAGALGLTLLGRESGMAGISLANAPPVSFASAQAIIDRRCVTCHAARPSNPSFPVPPSGITLEDPHRIRALAERIMVRAVVTKTMPLGNLTGMTEDERLKLGAWIAQGARIDPAQGTR